MVATCILHLKVVYINTLTEPNIKLIISTRSWMHGVSQITDSIIIYYPIITYKDNTTYY